MTAGLAWRRILAVTAAASAAAAAGCGTGASPAAGPAGRTAAAATSGPARPALPAAGAQLVRVLPARAQLPAGWTFPNPSGNETDSGPGLQPPPYLPVLARESCQGMRGADASALLMSDQASYAQLSLAVGRGPLTAGGQIDVDGYYPGYAERQLRLIESLYRRRCGPVRFRDELTRAPVVLKVTLAAVPGPGGQALLVEAVQSNGRLPDGTFYPGETVLIARAGNYLAAVAAPAFPGEPRLRAVRKVMSGLMARLRTLS